jgi:hypothetical protein
MEPSFLDIARICHEVNRQWCLYNGDTSQLPWNDAPEWARESALNGVEFHYDNPDASESASHDSWMKEKIEGGWKYGPTKDPERKLHPCIVPHSELPRDQQFKDRLFKTICDAAFNRSSA